MWLIFALISSVILCLPCGGERFTTGHRGTQGNGILGSAAHCGHDGDLRVVGHTSCESASVADVLIADEDVDVLSDLILLIEHSIPNPRIGIPKCGKCLSYSSA